jgi:phosphoribosyl-AMP cyclohydrolase
MLELDYDLGNTQKVKEILVDCDSDAIIYLVEPSGPAYVILVKKFAFIIN